MSAGLRNRDSIESGPAQKLCPACSRNFMCAAAAGGCWCDGVKLSAETRAALRARYDGCLCPECLSQLQTT